MTLATWVSLTLRQSVDLMGSRWAEGLTQLFGPPVAGKALRRKLGASSQQSLGHLLLCGCFRGGALTRPGTDVAAHVA